MTLSRRGDYVVRSALCLARAYAGGRPRKLREVVAEMGVPQTFASQILADLVRAGIADSRAGRDGGYRLVRSPESISLVEVVEAGEGPLRAERCALGDGPCRWEAVCPLHDTWRSATGALREVLASTTLASLADTDSAIESGQAPVPEDSHRRSRSSVAVTDSIQVEHGLVTVVEHLTRRSWVTSRASDAYAEAEAVRRAADSGGLAWMAKSRPAVRSERAASSGAGEARVELEWELGLPGGADSRLDATVELRELDPERTELRLTGRFRPPSSPSAPAVPSALATRLARVTIRAFMRNVAASIETGRSPTRGVRPEAPARIARSGSPPAPRSRRAGARRPV